MHIRNDSSALFKISYGLYVVTCKGEKGDNGLIVNTVTQLTDNPNRVAVTINKLNYSHDVIKETGILNVNCLDTTAPFSLFQNFGFQSGKDVDKFAGIQECRTENGLRVLPEHINAVLSLQVESYVDLDTHGMFICTVTKTGIVSDGESMTYDYYHAHVKPKAPTGKKKGYICKICGWIYEGEPLPEDIVCPLCKHGAADFEPLS